MLIKVMTLHQVTASRMDQRSIVQQCWIFCVLHMYVIQLP